MLCKWAFVLENIGVSSLTDTTRSDYVTRNQWVTCRLHRYLGRKHQYGFLAALTEVCGLHRTLCRKNEYGCLVVLGEIMSVGSFVCAGMTVLTERMSVGSLDTIVGRVGPLPEAVCCRICTSAIYGSFLMLAAFVPQPSMVCFLCLLCLYLSHPAINELFAKPAQSSMLRQLCVSGALFVYASVCLACTMASLFFNTSVHLAFTTGLRAMQRAGLSWASIKHIR